MSFQKFLDCHSIWLTLDGEHRDVARRSLTFVGENMKNVTTDVFDLYANFSYHRACYSTFTNNSNITRAPVRCQHKNTECEEADPSSSVREIVDTEQKEFQPAKTEKRCCDLHVSKQQARQSNQEIRMSCCTYVLLAREKSPILLSW